MVAVTASDSRLNLVFHALSDTTRRSILREIATQEKTVGDIAEPYEISLAAVSKHLKVLERAGLVVREKRGSYQFVRINTKPIKEAQDWLAYYEQFWDVHLQQLQKHLAKGRKR
jgi:DNA-binding transcriptional ArsR family regulator